MKITRRQLLAGGAAAIAGALRSRNARAQELGPGRYPLKLDYGRDGWLYVPKSYRSAPLPLVVMFHGAGGHGVSTEYAYPLADERGLIVLSPDSRDPRTWDMILGEVGPDVEFLGEALRQTMSRVRVDRNRLAVGGHSDGASYALSFGIGAGDVFGQILAFSPGVMQPRGVAGKPRIFIAHGTSDAIMPIDATSRRFAPRLKGLGYDVTYREYDGGHGLPTDIAREGFNWLALHP